MADCSQDRSTTPPLNKNLIHKENHRELGTPRLSQSRKRTTDRIVTPMSKRRRSSTPRKRRSTVRSLLKKRRRHQSSSSSTSGELSRKRRRNTSSSVSSSTNSLSSTPSKSSDISRSKTKRSQHTKTITSTIERFIDAGNNQARNSFVGMQDVIPTFNPSEKTQSTRAWLRRVNEIALIYDWSERQIFHALSKLSGLARRWYECLSSVDLTWKDWERKLLTDFPDDRNYAERLQEMLERKSRREESLGEYFYNKARLVSHCNIRGKDADCIIHGIFDHNIRLNAQGAGFKSPNKLLNKQ